MKLEGAAVSPRRSRTARHRMIAASLGALAILGLAGAEASAQSGDVPSLVVQTASFGRNSIADISLDLIQGVASGVDVQVPREYGFTLGQPAGTEVGYVTVFLTDARSSSGQFASGELVVEDPSSASAASATCAPGSHRARWRTELTLLGRSPLPLVVYVDAPGPGVEAAAVLRVCPIWESTGDAPAVFAQYVSLTFEDVLSEPATPVVTTWRAFVEPAALVGASYAPNPASRFELRSFVAHPHTIALAARYEPKKRSVLLTGRVMAAGEPEAQVTVRMAAWADDSDDLATFGPVTTNAAGAFSIRRRVTSSTTFTASVEPVLRSCQQPSTAAAGCRSETISPPDRASASVHIRGVHEAKLVPRARDGALARRATLRAGDVPPGWQGVVTSDPFFPCADFQPDLSKLTVHGESSSLIFIKLDESGAAWTSTEVYSSVEQARTAYARTAKIDAARCIANDSTSGGSPGASVGTLRLPRIGDATRAFRITVPDPEGTGYGDIVYVRRGRVLVRLSVITLDASTSLEVRLARAVAGRAH